jgi:hypothetical protein
MERLGRVPRTRHALGRFHVLAEWFRRRPSIRIGGAVCAVALAISGLFGGLNPVPLADRVNRVEPGREVIVQPFALTVERAVAVDELDGVAMPLVVGRHLMVVSLNVENLSDRSVRSVLLLPTSRALSYQDRSLVVLDDRLAPEAAMLYDVDTDTAVSFLSPGLSYRLAAVWEFGGPVPDRLPIGLAELTLRGGSASPDVLEWEDAQESATVTLPVHDSTSEST